MRSSSPGETALEIMANIEAMELAVQEAADAPEFTGSITSMALGADQVRRFYDYEMDSYVSGRTGFSNREVPLLEVEDQSYIY